MNSMGCASIINLFATSKLNALVYYDVSNMYVVNIKIQSWEVEA